MELVLVIHTCTDMTFVKAFVVAFGTFERVIVGFAVVVQFADPVVGSK